MHRGRGAGVLHRLGRHRRRLPRADAVLEAGRAGRRADEDALWSGFKTAQDTFFQARAEVYSAKDAALREHAAVKSQLLEEAAKLVPVTDVRAARAALRGIQERWEQAGPVPRQDA